MPMQFRNVASWDRLLRVLAGSILLALGWLEVVPGVWGIALKLFGWVPLVTGLVGWSPLYTLLNFSTLDSDHQQTE